MDALIPDEEVRLIKAVALYRGGRGVSITKAARELAVPYSKLRRRLDGAKARRMNGGHNKHFTLTQEKTLTEWLDRLIRSGFPPRLEFLCDRANLLLAAKQLDSDHTPMVGKNWPTNFLMRHPQYKAQSCAPLEMARASSTTPSVLNGWFHRFKGAQHEFGITNDDIYNVDETGFQTGVAQRTRLICWKSMPSATKHSLHTGDRTWITSIECIGANGRVLPPLLILPCQLHQSTWYRTEIPQSWHIATTETGWTNDNIAMKWLENVFEPTTRPWTKGAYRMLIMDGHGSHVMAEFILYCWNHRIVPLCLPPHTSHLLQPLDVSCFSPLKHYHSLGVMDGVQQGTTTFDKVDFLSQFPAIRLNAFKETNIRSAFSNSGLIPFRPRVVLDQISLPTRPVTPLRPGEVHLHRTPTTLRQVQVHGEHLLSALDRELVLDPSLQPLHQQMMKFVKAAECAFTRALIQEKELIELKQAAEARAVKASRRRNYIQDGGVLRVERALQLIEEKETKQREEAEKKQRNAAARAARAAQRSNNTGASL